MSNNFQLSRALAIFSKPIRIDELVMNDDLVSIIPGLGTITTNSTSAPGDDWDFGENGGICWSNNDPLPNPLTASITKLYVTNEGEEDAVIVGAVIKKKAV